MATQKLIIHERTGIILRIEGSIENDGETSVTWDGDPISLKPDGITKYWKRGTTGRIPATTKDIIESGFEDVTRAQKRQELINAMDAMIADTLIQGRIKTFITKLRAYFDYTL